MKEKSVQQLLLAYKSFSYDDVYLRRNAKGVTYFDYHSAVCEFAEAMLEIIGYSRGEVLAIMPEITCQTVTADWINGEFFGRSALNLIEDAGYLNE